MTAYHFTHFLCMTRKFWINGCEQTRVKTSFRWNIQGCIHCISNPVISFNIQRTRTLPDDEISALENLAIVDCWRLMHAVPSVFPECCQVSVNDEIHSTTDCQCHVGQSTATRRRTIWHGIVISCQWRYSIFYCDRTSQTSLSLLLISHITLLILKPLLTSSLLGCQ